MESLFREKLTRAFKRKTFIDHDRGLLSNQNNCFLTYNLEIFEKKCIPQLIVFYSLA